MKNPEDIAIMIQARMSSQRCKKKMTRPFAGSTLMDICLEKLVSSNISNKNLWVSVYEDELIDVCSKYPVNIFHRSKKSAMSEGTPITEIYEWWNKLPQKYVILVNACVPLLSASVIENFLEAYSKSDCNGMFGVVEKKDYFWDENNNFLTPLTEGVMNTKTAKIIKQAAHCLYAGKMSSIGDGVWMGNFNNPGEINLYPVPENETFDIDYEWQFQSVEVIYKGTKNE